MFGPSKGSARVIKGSIGFRVLGFRVFLVQRSRGLGFRGSFKGMYKGALKRDLYGCFVRV